MTGPTGRSVRGLTGTIAIAALVALVATGVLAPAAARGDVREAQGSSAVVASAAPPPNPYTDTMPATYVLGSSSFNFSECYASPNTTSDTASLAFDSAGDLWVVDRGDNRTLEFVPPFQTNMSASIEIGQSSFYGYDRGLNNSSFDDPSGIAFDAAGDLWVTDTLNNRVLEFVPPFTSGMNASLVLGQSSFTENGSGTSASTMDYPEDLAFAPNGDLFVSDADNARVLIFAPPFHSGMNATAVLGQADFEESAYNLNATSLDFPVGLAFNAQGDLFVADSENNRVLEFTPPFTTDKAASLVIGQPNFLAGIGGTNATAMIEPFAVTVDPRGDLWVGDWDNDRMLEFVPPFSDGMAASVVLGQPSFTASGPGTTSSASLSGPHGAAFDAQGDLWVADEFNCRVLGFVPSHFPLVVTESGLPAGTLWSVTVGATSVAGTTSSLTLPVYNGSYTYQLWSQGGYAPVHPSGGVVVNGSAEAIHVSFTSTTVLGVAAGLFWGVVSAVLGLVVVVETVFLLRSRRGPRVRAPPSPVDPASLPVPPPGAGGSPPPPPG